MTGEELLFWGLGLLAAALLLIVIEVFVPSGGVIALTATGCAITGLVFLFRYSTGWGVSGTIAMLVMTPVAFSFALKIWPSTPIGRKMLGTKTPEEEEAERLAAFKEREKQMSLIGAEGVVVSDLRPVGLIKIGNERLEALSETGVIRAGARVRVTSIESNQIKVRGI